MKAKMFLMFAVMIISITAMAQQRPTPIDLALGATSTKMMKDTATLGEGNEFIVDLAFRTKYIDFIIGCNYVTNVLDTAAGDRMKIRGMIGNTQFGWLGSGTGYYESVYNEIFVGYEYFIKANHYQFINDDGTATTWRKEAVTHSVIFSERVGITSEGVKNGTVKAFREQELHFFGAYAFSESMKTTFGEKIIKSPLDNEDVKTFFFDAGYSAEVFGISCKRNKVGIGFDAGISYTNMTPFGSFNAWKFTGGISLNSYKFIGHAMDIYYTRTSMGDGIGANEIGIKINPMALFHGLR